MKKITLLIVLSIVVAQCIQAKQLNSNEAQKEVSKFLRTNSRMLSIDSSSDLQLAYTESTGEVKNFYVFNADKGYVIASADDRVEPILGYCENGTFDFNSIPDAMRYMLEEFKKEINYAISNNLGSNTRLSQQSIKRTPIAPLCTTKWNQSSPYNDLCPLYDNTRRCVTGCTATSMAQVMKYYNWPDKGVGSKTYTTTINQKETTLSLDFSNTTFDWTNMTDTYNSQSTSQQKTAVATLMYNCGVACQMNYGLSSGAAFVYAHRAYANNFKYDKSVKMIRRMYYSIEEWNNLIYTELANKRVVQYAGYNTDAGHAFVCDGYSDNDFFHINWGWGGTSDGYFKLSALTPSSQGIGGSNDGYNYNQEIIYNIKKNDGGSYCYTMGFASDFTPSTTTISNSSDKVDFPIKKVTFFSALENDVNIRLGVYAENIISGEKTFIPCTNFYYTITPDLTYSFDCISFNRSSFSILANGSYTLTPAYQNTSTNQYGNAIVPYGCINSCHMVKQNSTLTFSSPTKEEPNIKCENISDISAFYVGKSFHLKATLSNSGSEFHNDIYPIIFDSDNNVICAGNAIIFDIKKGEETTQDLYGKIDDNVAVGEYFLGLGTKDDSQNSYKLLSGYCDIEIKKLTEETTVSADDPVVANAGNLDGSNISISSVIRCNSGFFTDMISCAVYDSKYSLVSNIFSDPLFLNSKESKTANFTLSISDAKINDEFSVAIFQYNSSTGYKRLTNFIKFTITSGIDDIHSDESYSVYPNPASDVINITSPEYIKQIKVYTLSGEQVINMDVEQNTTNIAVDINNLAPGVYIIKTHTSSDTKVSRIIKK